MTHPASLLTKPMKSQERIRPPAREAAVMLPAPRRVLNILVVDDDDADAMMISEALHSSDADVVVDRVADGREALEFLHRTGEHAAARRPDLILLDLNMPRMGGQE